ncbi:MAG: diguanylate cyclase [Betaproteobacteria bacterium]|nr:diguanylate cyclase [Betaproteobacteria bacterium]
MLWLAPHAALAHSLGWAGAMAAALGLMSVATLRRLADARSGTSQPGREPHLFVLGALLAGTAWGALPFLGVVEPQEPLRTPLLLVGGLCLVATGALVFGRAAFHAFAVPAVAGLAVFLLLRGDAGGAWGAAGFGALLAGLHHVNLGRLLAAAHFQGSGATPPPEAFQARPDSVPPEHPHGPRPFAASGEPLGGAARDGALRDLVALASDWYWEQDGEGRFTRITVSATAPLAHPPFTLLGRCLWELEHIRGVSAEQWRSLRDRMQQQNAFRDFAYQVEAAAGEVHWYSISGQPLKHADGRFAGYQGVGLDVTEQMRGEERYRFQANHDPLTGLPNRRVLDDRLEQAVVQARRQRRHVAVMVLDLDHFKVINDTEGHAAGDHVLGVVAERLRALVRESDTVVRLGGDEFVVLLPEIAQVRDAVTVAEKIIAGLKEPIMVGERHHVIGVSIGVAIFPDHAALADSLLERADQAMYAAKRRGGSGYEICNRAGDPAAVDTTGVLDDRRKGCSASASHD